MSDFRDLDPVLWTVADKYLGSLMEVIEALPDRELERLVRRLAGAMQQAIEAECEAIRKELTT